MPACPGNYQLNRKTQTGSARRSSTSCDRPRGLPNGLSLSTMRQPAAVVGIARRGRRQLPRPGDAQPLERLSTWSVAIRPRTPACLPSVTGVPTPSRPAAGPGRRLQHRQPVLQVRGAGREPPAHGPEFTLNVNNVFDTDPPMFRSIGASTRASPTASRSAGWSSSASRRSSDRLPGDGVNFWPGRHPSRRPGQTLHRS